MTARSKIEQAEAQVGQRLRQAGERKPNRRTLRALPEVETVTETPEVVSTDVDTTPAVEDVAVAVDVLTADRPKPAAPVAPVAATTTRPSKTRKGSLPTWRSLATPPAARGTATNQRRLNVPCSPAVVTLLNSRDKQLMEEGNRWRINRSDLLNTAIEVLAANPTSWVDQWETSRLEEGPATTALQGRISDDHQRQLAVLRYLDDGRVINTGPVLAIIVRAILDQDG